MNSISIVFFCVTIILLRQCTAIPPPPIVTVNKCCRIGESLNENHQCIIGGESNWWPIIFMILKKSYFQPHGNAPRFFRVRERTHPYCPNQDYYIGTHSMALFSNGSLYLSEKHKFIEPNNFCVDKDISIVCDPDNNTPDALMLNHKPIKIRKCCGKNGVYKATENMCVSSGNDVASTETILSNSMQINYVYAFPNCKVSKYITMAEKFNETNLNIETGRLRLESGKKVDSENYCLEHVFMNDIVNEISVVHVFTCADHLSQPTNPSTEIPMVNSKCV